MITGYVGTEEKFEDFEAQLFDEADGNLGLMLDELERMAMSQTRYKMHLERGFARQVLHLRPLVPCITSLPAPAPQRRGSDTLDAFMYAYTLRAQMIQPRSVVVTRMDPA